MTRYFSRIRLRGTFMMLFVLFSTICANSQASVERSSEMYRPQIHFSPLKKWMNDPNGMVFYKGTYHLFYQYYPDSTVWGPMHWGHATSNDLVHWKHQPIALYPDKLGYIFSGSAVVDMNNTSGLGKDGQVPLVAIFTHHDPQGEKTGKSDYQNQSIAYSLDDGKTWVKYEGNPVLRNPGIIDFRDPKVMWHAPAKKWIMTLAVKDRIHFYSSVNLKDWSKESEFGNDIGAHGGVWECPDLFQLTQGGRKYWVLIVNLNPGGPNGGSATQYFVGEFNGSSFRPIDTKTRWLDYGPDEYAGITWSNTGDRKIFFGWMSNWLYANVVPTDAWRNAMTIPRELQLHKVQGELLLASSPVKELSTITGKPVIAKALKPGMVSDVSKLVGPVSFPCRLELAATTGDLSIELSNPAGEKLEIGFDSKANEYYIDRKASGKIDFQKDFAARHTAPRFSRAANMDIVLVIDVASVELFADNGLSVMTEIFFPGSPYNKIELKTGQSTMVRQFKYSKMKGIWPGGTFK